MYTYHIRLEPNSAQRTAFARHAGVARWAYNWGLDVCKQAYENKEKRPSAIDLHKKLVAEVKPIKPWMYESSKCAPQQALRDLDRAWLNYFRDLKNGTIDKKKSAYIKECKIKGREINNDKLYNIGKPKFHKKGERDSFYLDGTIRGNGNKIKLPKIGWVKCSESLPEVPFKSVTISRESDHWFVSFISDVTPLKVYGIENMPTIGVDLGIKTLATLSDGKQFATNRKLFHQERKLKRLQRKLSRQNKGGKNRERTKRKIARVHYRISCSRGDQLHKLTTYLAKNHSTIGIEDLNVKGMVKNHNLAGHISNASFYEFRRQLEYKCAWYGSRLVVIDRFYPSSKTCSCCGAMKQDLKLKDRMFACPVCGTVMDRDLNAAVNIGIMAASLVVTGPEVREVTGYEPVPVGAGASKQGLYA